MDLHGSRRLDKGLLGPSLSAFQPRNDHHLDSFCQLAYPDVLTASYEAQNRPGLFFAGQMTGVEGYVESAGSGLVAGINAAREALGEETVAFPKDTALGSMANYITTTSAKNFQPMNASFALLPALEGKKIRKKRERHEKISERGLASLDKFKAEVLD